MNDAVVSITDLCNCGHTLERHSGLGQKACGHGGCDCVRFVLSSLHSSKCPPIIAGRLAELEAARAASTKAKASIEATLAAEKQAERAVAQAFLDLYNELPRDIRNKIRHAINTTKDGDTEDSPKRAE